MGLDLPHGYELRLTEGVRVYWAFLLGVGGITLSAGLAWIRIKVFVLTALGIYQGDFVKGH